MIRKNTASRVPWPVNFPDVFIHCSLKREITTAAMTLLSLVITPQQLSYLLTIERLCHNSLHQDIQQQDAILVPIGALRIRIQRHSISDGRRDSLRTGLPVDEDNFFQSNRVGHTQARMWQRLVTPALFDGVVQQGQQYILVDDHVGAGGTLTNLRGYIETNGGKVIAMTTLTASSEAEKISLPLVMQNMLYSKYEENLEQLWQEHFGYGLNCLTAVEARTIYREQSVEAIRNFLFKATDEANSRGAQTAESLKC